MDALFWIGQVIWVAFLACGAYVSFSFYDLADAESARTAKPEIRVAAAQTVSEDASSLHPIS